MINVQCSVSGHMRCKYLKCQTVGNEMKKGTREDNIHGKHEGRPAVATKKKGSLLQETIHGYDMIWYGMVGTATPDIRI